MDKQRFNEICERVISSEREKKGIGTLREKTLHAVLKQYFDPLNENQEISIGSFIADIFNKNGIIEIQTRDFNKLRKKLEAFLKTNSVTVVYPIPYIKWLIWINPENGEMSKKRKSPKQGKIHDIFFELYKIKHLLGNPNLRFCIVLVDVKEYRFLNGWGKDKKHGSTRYDRIPIDMIDEVYINGIQDYIKFIPEELKKTFTSKDYRIATGLSLNKAQTALNILNSLQVIKRVGKMGNSYLYERDSGFSNII